MMLIADLEAQLDEQKSQRRLVAFRERKLSLPQQLVAIP